MGRVRQRLWVEGLLAEGVAPDAPLSEEEQAAADTGVADAGAADAGAADAGAADTGAADTGAADAGAVESGAADTGVADIGAVESGVEGETWPERIRESLAHDATLLSALPLAELQSANRSLDQAVAEVVAWQEMPLDADEEAALVALLECTKLPKGEIHPEALALLAASAEGHRELRRAEFVRQQVLFLFFYHHHHLYHRRHICWAFGRLQALVFYL
ncbi:hypothetical protein T492DRAFT_438174 [Pavlovales sp. CCMP2436]|nr:hypothetical protein T492DRAFT_438174 [Pavlovales sp. CCMP2436]